MASFLIVENASLATTYPDVCTAYMMHMTVPVTVATAERTFSKLKLIKNFLQSSMSQERLSVLTLLSIELAIISFILCNYLSNAFLIK